jgi:hypothetical protein
MQMCVCVFAFGCGFVLLVRVRVLVCEPAHARLAHSILILSHDTHLLQKLHSVGSLGPLLAALSR